MFADVCLLFYVGSSRSELLLLATLVSLIRVPIPLALNRWESPASVSAKVFSFLSAKHRSYVRILPRHTVVLLSYLVSKNKAYDTLFFVQVVPITKSCFPFVRTDVANDYPM